MAAVLAPARADALTMVNLACGRRFHDDWINLDFHGDGTRVRAANLLGRLPFDDDSVDVAYSSHFVEHLDDEQLGTFVAEVRRILRPGGVFRVVVPDLENLAREYLARLSDVRADPSTRNLRRLEFAVLEMIDQMVRNEPGGRLLGEYTRIRDERDEDTAQYAHQRTGESLLAPPAAAGTASPSGRSTLSARLLYRWVSLVTRLIPASVRTSVINRTTVGERHLWMWDEPRLRRYLEQRGFVDVRPLAHDRSGIPDFARYRLDTNEDGTPYKGAESLYLEAVKGSPRRGAAR